MGSWPSGPWAHGLAGRPQGSAPATSGGREGRRVWCDGYGVDDGGMELIEEILEEMRELEVEMVKLEMWKEGEGGGSCGGGI